jgi:hypothetical protein
MSGVKRQIRHQTSTTADLLRLVLHVVMEAVDTTGGLRTPTAAPHNTALDYQPN